MLRIFGNESAAEARWPAVLVVEPGEHLASFCFPGAGAHLVDKFRAEIRRLQTGARVQMKPTEAHLLELGDLAKKLRAIQPAVPRPKRCASINRGGSTEERLGQTARTIGGIER